MRPHAANGGSNRFLFLFEQFAGKVTELKRQAALADSFQCLTAAFPVHLVAPSAGPRDWPARLQAALEAWASTVAVATPLLASGQNNDLLDDTVPASMAANCQLLFPILAPPSGGSTGAAVGPAGLVTVAGTVDLRAVVHQRDTVAVAAQVRVRTRGRGPRHALMAGCARTLRGGGRRLRPTCGGPCALGSSCWSTSGKPTTQVRSFNRAVTRTSPEG